MCDLAQNMQKKMYRRFSLCIKWQRIVFAKGQTTIQKGEKKLYKYCEYLKIILIFSSLQYKNTKVNKKIITSICMDQSQSLVIKTTGKFILQQNMCFTLILPLT